MILRGATSLLGVLEGVGPENRDFFGPWNGTSEASAIWAQKSYPQAEHTQNSVTLWLSYPLPQSTRYPLTKSKWK
jgi:hypothetical protein